MSDDKIASFFFEGEMRVRVVERDDGPWFVAADVCRALGISNSSQAIDGLDDDEKGISSTYTLGGTQEVLVVSESGLYTVILRCRDALKKGTLPHRFRRWVTGEVLPSIRSAKSEIAIGAPPPEALKVRLVCEARQTFGCQASAQLWFSLGLPIVPAMRLMPPQGDLFRGTGAAPG